MSGDSVPVEDSDIILTPDGGNYESLPRKTRRSSVIWVHCAMPV
ncbi:MAG TPA: hypothetical protein O0X23_00660 [Methanocorpusculum sp.]|nr:hypothetical protein [Methanocorpusculum sp.]